MAKKSVKKATVTTTTGSVTATPANEPKRKDVVLAVLGHDQVLTENSDGARDFYSQSRLGEPDGSGRIQLSLYEALYLAEKEKLKIVTPRNKEVPIQTFIRKAKQAQKSFWTKYLVFRDMRNRGYIVKTALKFGADFRVYERGVKPGEDHAKWILYPIHESQSLTWHDFSAKNRVAHSTKKHLLLGIVDEEGDVTYYQVSWERP